MRSINNYLEKSISPAEILSTVGIIIAACLPLLNLIIWESDLRLHHSLSLRVITVWIELLACLILGWNMSSRLRTHISEYKNISIAITFILLIGFIGSLNSTQPYASFVRQAEFTLHVLYIYLLSQHVNNYVKRSIVTAGIFLALLYSSFHFFLMRLAVGDTPYNWVQDIPFYVNIRHWTYLHVLALPLTFALITNQNHRVRMLGHMLFFITWVCIFWSGARAGLLSALIVSIIFVIVTRPSIYRIATALTFMLLALLSAILIEGNHPSLSISRLFFLPVIEQPFDANLNQISSNRITLATNALKEVWHHSPLLGMGPDSYRYSTSVYTNTPYAHPHNSLVHFIYEYGFLALGALLFLAYKGLQYLITAFSRNKISNLSLGYGLSVLACILASLFCGALHHTFSITSLALITGAFVNSITSTSTSKSPPKKNQEPQKSKLLIIALLPFLVVWGLHTKTFLFFMEPLRSEKQILSTTTFPSLYLTSNWINAEANKHLLKKALIHGSRWSDTQCAHLKLLELKFNDKSINKSKDCQQTGIGYD